MRAFIEESLETKCRILTKLGARIERGQDAADPKSTAPPSREWVRACALYCDGVRHVAQLELEHAKVRILADRAGHKPPMSDEEFQAQIQALGRQALDTLSADELEQALARKRALVVVDVPTDS
jgi:hypothetical protein